MKEKKKFKNRRVFFLAGAVLFIGACIPSMGGGGPSIVIQTSTDSDDTKTSPRKRTNRSRTGVSPEFHARTDADACSGHCKDICLDLYNDSLGAQEECLKLKKETVDDLDAIVSILADPEISELKAISHKIFKVFLSLSVEPWVKALRKADRKEAGLILAWIAQTKNISSVILEYGSTGDYADFKSYEGLKELLKAISREGSTDCGRYVNSFFEETLNESGFAFCDIAVREGNSKLYNTSAESGILGDFFHACGDCWVEAQGETCGFTPAADAVINDPDQCDID